MKYNMLPILLATTFLSTSAVAQTIPEINADYLNSLTGEKVTWEEATTSGEDTVQIGDKFYKYTYHKPENYTEISTYIGEIPQGSNITNTVFTNITHPDSASVTDGIIFGGKNDKNSVNADFINNNTTSVAATGVASFSNISGDFIANNLGDNYGAAVLFANALTTEDDTHYEVAKAVDNINGSFIANSGNVGSAILGVFADVGSITGNFIGNHSDTAGAVILSLAGAERVSGIFIGNYAGYENDKTLSEQTVGGAIMGIAVQSVINSKFYNNYARGENSAGGAVAGIIGEIKNSDFIGNYAEATGFAGGGAATVAQVTGDGVTGTLEGVLITNSNFINNYVSGQVALGGAIATDVNLSIIADNGTSTFSGNKANDKSNAITMLYNTEAFVATTTSENVTTINEEIDFSAAEDYLLKLNFEAKNGGTITVDDGINSVVIMEPSEGTTEGEIVIPTLYEGAYKLNISGDAYNVEELKENPEANSVRFNNVVDNVYNLTIEKVQMALGQNAVINIIHNYVAKDNPYLRLDLDAESRKVGQLNIEGDVEGITNVIVNVIKDKETAKSDSIVFATAVNNTLNGEEAFKVARVIGSPYMWNVNYNDTAKTWGLYSTEDENPDYEEPVEPDTPGEDDTDTPDNINAVSAPEVIAGIGLHTAGIEQTRTVVRNVSGKVANARSYCPNCGIISDAWNGKQLRNAWVLAQGENANIDKAVDMEAKIWGVEGGFDLQSDMNNTFGVFASYRNGEYDLSGKGARYRSNIGSEIEIDSYLAGLYYRYDKNMNWLFATVYGGTQEAEANTEDGIASFETDGLEFGASAEIGHSFVLNNTTTLSPSLGIFYTQINYDDADDNVGKEYKWEDIKHLEAELGLSLSKNFENGKAYIKPSVIQTLTADDEVSITGLNEIDTYHDQTLGRIEIGGNYGFNDNWSAYGWANYTFGSSYDATSLGAGLNYAW